MLAELHIQNYAVIDHLSLEFCPGLNLLSGETGSGKSILVDALGLALGGRASPDVIRTGQDRATVTAVFRAASSGAGTSSTRTPWAEWLEEYGLAASAEPEIMLRREVQSAGKSRMLVNDQPVTLTAVKALSALLVEVHGQGEHVALLSREAQLDLLDEFAGTVELLREVGELHTRRRALERELESLNQNEQDRLRTIDLLSFQLQELERAHLELGEDARLEEEKRILANLEKIRAAAANAFGQLYDEQGSAFPRVVAALRSLEELVRYDASTAPNLELLKGTRANLEDIALSLRDYLHRAEANPERLEEVEDRLALLDRLKRKYGKTLEEVVAHLEKARKQLETIRHADERSDELRQELEKASAEYHKAARKLSEQRMAAARRMVRLVAEELAQLGMEKARFEVHFATPSEASSGPRGIDEVEFQISPNPGEELRPLEKIASGGELSRLMLALKTVSTRARLATAGGATRRAAPTFVFDEVDAGIGGRAAESVGQRLKRLARDAQVLCVTHLAQIACFADHHFYVEKYERAGRSVTTVTYLESGKERAQELARMLSGRQVTETAIKHAATMLKQAAAS